MLKEELSELYKNKKDEIAVRQQKQEKVRAKRKKSVIYKLAALIKDKNDEIYWKRYDKKTRKIIKRLPGKLKRLAKSGVDHADIHVYFHDYLMPLHLYPNSAGYYLDRRGKDIVEYLKSQDIPYRFSTYNGIFESYYTIRVLFKTKW